MLYLQIPLALTAMAILVCGRLKKAVYDKFLLDNLDDGVVSSPDWWADPETYLAFTKTGALKGGKLVYRTGQAVVHFFGLKTPKTVAQLTLSRSLASIAGNRTGVVAGRFILAKAGIDAAGGLFFGTFETLKKHMAVYFPGVVKQGFDGKYTWVLHHIVEQRTLRRGFEASVVHNSRNVVALPDGKGSLHQAIGAYYGKKFSRYGNRTVREYMDTLDEKTQFEEGVKIMSETFGLKLQQVESKVAPGVMTWVVTNVDEVVERLPQIKGDYGLN